MNTRKYIVIIASILLITAAVFLLPSVYTSKGSAHGGSTEASCFIDDTQDPIVDQGDGLCGAYAAAYVLRYFGIDADGSKLGAELHRVFNFTSPNSVARLLRDNDLEAKAYHGDLDTLKECVSQGAPVIVFIRNHHDTHYAVVTGYDENNIYLADSLSGNANEDEKLYNRILTIDAFEKMWKTGTLLDDNIYISVKEKR